MSYNEVDEAYECIPIVSINRLPLIGFGRALVIWLPYCNFRCPWCFFKTVVEGKSIKHLTIRKLRSLIHDHSSRVEYLHVTGGEPTLHPKALTTLFEIAHDFSLKTSLDTNLSKPSILSKLLRGDLLDHVTCDVKAPLRSAVKYSQAIGLPTDTARSIIENIVASLKKVCNSNVNVEVRTVVVPNLICEGDVYAIIEDLTDIGVDFDKVRYVISQYAPSSTVLSEEYKPYGPTSVRLLSRIAEEAKLRFGVKPYVRVTSEMLKEFKEIKIRVNPPWQYRV